MTDIPNGRGSSPASRGGAGIYIEGELGAFYALALLAGTEARGLPGARLERIRFQGADRGFALDDIILEGVGAEGPCLLEIQSKRDATFAPKDKTFEDVARQVARSGQGHVPEECHHLAVATQRTSRTISGAYQDVLLWARDAENGSEFFARLKAEGVANDQMRQFAATFRNHLVTHGVTDDDDLIWRRLRRFQILEFDFESTSPLSRTHALMLARLVLAHEDVPRAEGLWSALIELAISTGRTGGALDRDAIRAELQRRGFRLAGDRDHRPARALLRETARQTLENIRTTVAGVHLPRHAAIAATGEALDGARFVLLSGGPGVGKSGVFRGIAERAGRESTLLVFDSDTTPAGGWIAFAGRFGIQGLAGSFLADIAASGGGLICIDGIDMITDPAQQRTINDVLREAGRIEGFRVIASARADSEIQATDWLADDLRTTFGPSRTVTVDDLTDAEAEALTAAAPHLRSILAAGAPAAPIARNLHRLSRLARLNDAASIRTEAGLAKHWWDRADDAPLPAVRPAQRILADLAQSALAGERDVELAEDGQARAHLLGRRTLREVRRDRIDFQHDVLRDWAIGAWLAEDPERVSGLDLTRPPSPRVQRGIEFAARFVLEGQQGVGAWTDILKRLEKLEANGGWRRAALLAIVRSEAAPHLLEQATLILLADDSAQLKELIVAILALETVAAREVIGPDVQLEVPQSLRIGRGGHGLAVLLWASRHRAQIPIAAVAPIVDLVGTEALLLLAIPPFARPVATMLYDWLLQLDLRDRSVIIPMGSNTTSQNERTRRSVVADLRTAALLLSQHAPDEAKSYLREATREGDPFKTREILKSSSALAAAAPEELASLVKSNLKKPKRDRKFGRDPLEEAFSHADGDFQPSSPAQPPFLDLLNVAPAVGLPLIHHLVDTAVTFATKGQEPSSADGFTIVFDDGPRFFPWRDTYLWSRDQSRSYAVGSALKALEAWGHQRLDAGDSVGDVVRDVMGPSGSCAAFLLVAVDLLLSHWPKTRVALMPFLTDPALLAVERGRVGYEQFGIGRSLHDYNEPKGRVMLADLADRPSRRTALEAALPEYLADNELGRALRERLAEAVARIGPYSENADFGDAGFMGAYALNRLNAENWVELRDGRMGYQSPPEEADHFARQENKSSGALAELNLDARIRLAFRGGEQATSQTARDAVIRAAGALPVGTDDDGPQGVQAPLIMTALLVARDGDDALLAEHEGWVRTVIDRTLTVAENDKTRWHKMLDYNCPAIAILATIHLWRRGGEVKDRDRLIELAARYPGDGCVAFAEGRETVVAEDRRVFKAAMRAALSACVWRWHPHNEDDAIQLAFEEARTSTVDRAVAAEIAWLDGAAEPDWPVFPVEAPRRRRGFHLPAARGASEDHREDDPTEYDPHGGVVHADTKNAAKWLGVHDGLSHRGMRWDGEIVATYAAWTADRNGAGQDSSFQAEAWHDEWNDAFYAHLAHVLMDAPDERFEQELARVVLLPDDMFARAASVIARAADVIYFNDPTCPAGRAVVLRRRLVERAVTMQSWQFDHEPGALSIDYDTRDLFGTLLFNQANALRGTSSYLVPSVADRIDPLLDAVSALQNGGRTTYIALCTMNALLVRPHSRHLNFVLDATEAWHARLPGHDGLWHGMGVGRKVVEWLEAAIEEDPELVDPAHSARPRIDRLLDRLINAGVAPAHDLAAWLQNSAGSH
ncbi:hypothetical protein [Acuticoccus sediminis]|uniref:hypothetical protein n=1 Tax=Acuticoccus sediminis TaxID=2184697 RepID=UPI001CFED87F|nr:hypothetical protein [Acuticoccus sediminis]